MIRLTLAEIPVASEYVVKFEKSATSSIGNSFPQSNTSSPIFSFGFGPKSITIKSIDTRPTSGTLLLFIITGVPEISDLE